MYSIQMKAAEQYFPTSMRNKLVLALDSLDELLER